MSESIGLRGQGDFDSGSPGSAASGAGLWVSLGASVLVGLVFIFAGSLKAYDPYSFYAQILGYGLVGHLPAKLAAGLLPGVEVGLGAWLVVGPHRRLAALALAGLVLVFLVATGHAWAAGSVDNCGCFGEFVRRSPKQTFFEDLGLLGLLFVAAWFSKRGEAPKWPGLRLAAAGLAAAGTVGWSAWNGALEISRTGRVASGLVVADWTLKEARIPGYAPTTHPPKSLRKGYHILVFFSPLCRHCWLSVRDVQALTKVRGLSSVVAVTHDGFPKRVLQIFAQHIQKEGGSYPIVLIPRARFRRLVSGTPVTAVIHNGVVLVAVDGVPPPEAIRRLVESP